MKKFFQAMAIICMFLTIFSTQIENKPEYKNIKKIIRYNITDKPVEISFKSSLVKSSMLVFFSELGDCTFTLCLIFAMRAPKSITFLISMAALISMNTFSIMIGLCIPLIVYPSLLIWLAILSFFLYGILLLNESRRFEKDEYEYVEVKREEENEKRIIIPKLKKSSSGILSYYYVSKNMNSLNDSEYKPYKKLFSIREAPEEKENISSCIDSRLDENLLFKINADNTMNSENINLERSNNMLYWCFFSSIVIAECGDRSQIVTVIISSVYNTLGVIMGTLLAITLTTFMAVYLGKYLSKYISDQMVSILFGLLLLIYACEMFLLKIM